MLKIHEYDRMSMYLEKLSAAVCVVGRYLLQFCGLRRFCFCFLTGEGEIVVSDEGLKVSDPL